MVSRQKTGLLLVDQIGQPIRTHVLTDLKKLTLLYYGNRKCHFFCKIDTFIICLVDTNVVKGRMNPDAKSNIHAVVPYLNLKDVIEDIPVVTRMKIMKDVRKSVEVVSKIGELQP